jgi:8-oxo-dGTP diphosphatase
MPSTEAEQVPAAIPVVAAIIRHPLDPRKILISRRRQGQHLEHLWEFPGGKQEPGEPRFHALCRELEEELGIRHLIARPFFRLTHDYPEKRICLDVWEVRSFTGEPEGREGQSWRWASPDELGTLAFPEADRPVLQALTLPGKILVTPEPGLGHHRDFTGQLERSLARHHHGAVLLRAHPLPDDRYAELALRCKVICERYQAELIVHRPTLDGLMAARLEPFRSRHLSAAVLTGLEQSPFDEGIRLSASCHDRFELSKATALGCRFAFLSPVRKTLSHPGRPTLGWAGLRAISESAPLPVYALGGVGRKDFAVAREQGAIGVAGISDFWMA